VAPERALPRDRDVLLNGQAEGTECDQLVEPDRHPLPLGDHRTAHRRAVVRAEIFDGQVVDVQRDVPARDRRILDADVALRAAPDDHGAGLGQRVRGHLAAEDDEAMATGALDQRSRDRIGSLVCHQPQLIKA
jgi:hypothetical protein